MSDSDEEGFREAHLQTLTIKPNRIKSIPKLSKKDAITIISKPTLSMHNDLPLFEYPRGMDSFQDVDCKIEAPSVCRQPLDAIRKMEDVPPQLLSDFFPRTYICVYNRFRENPALKHDLTITIRNISRSVRHEELTTFALKQPPVASGVDHCFTADFEGGNLHWVFKDKRSKVYYLLLQNDTNTHGYNQWFHFGITPRELGKYQFVIANLSREIRFGGSLALLTYKMSTGRYQRKVGFTCAESRLKKCDRELNYWSLHFQYEFEETGQVFFSLAAPYSHSKAMRMIKDVIQHNYEHVDVKWELAAKSELGNAIVCLRISKKGKFASKEVIITARQHPSESVGSFVCDSIISILVSNSPLCRSLLERFTFIILPMINPDGVVHGNSRTSAMGYDLNRCWNNKGVTYSKQCQQIWKYLGGICQHQHVKWAFDLHGHSRELGYFAYFSEKNERSILMDSELRKHSFYQADKSIFELNHRVKESIRGQLHRYMKIANAVTIQTSLFGVRDQQGRFIHFEGRHFKQIAQNLLCSLLETERIMLDAKIKQSILSSIMQNTAKSNLDDRKQKEFDSDSNPQRDYLQEQERRLNNIAVLKEKPLFVRRFKTDQSTSKQKIRSPPILRLHISPSPLPNNHQPISSDKTKPLMNTSLRLLSKTKKTDKGQLFNLTFFASRNRVFPHNDDGKSRVRSERRLYSGMKKREKTAKQQFSQSQQLKKSLDMRRCVKIAFSNRSKNDSNRSRQGLKTIAYPTVQNIRALPHARQNMQLRKNQMKELRSQQYGALMTNSLSKAFSMRFSKQQSDNPQ